jgi:hypothetical protein
MKTETDLARERRLMSDEELALDDRLRDENADHTSGAPAPADRSERRDLARERTIKMIQKHGNGYRTATKPLQRSAERLFGSWAKACIAAGLEPPPRGRPPVAPMWG